MKPNYTSFTIALFIAMIATMGMLTTEFANAQDWYDTDWQYRREVTIENPGATELTDYQVLITLDNSFNFVHVNADGSDIRLTDTDGTTLIPFWIEDWDVGSELARIWFKMPSISIGGSTAYFYYGNSAASSTSDGTTTFSLFDDETWESSGGSLNPVHVATQPWWEATVSYPVVFEDNSFPERARFHMLYDGHHVPGVGHAKGYTTSPDLINWTAWDNGLSGSDRINPIMGVGYTGSTQFAWGDVIKVGLTYHMYPSSGPGTTVHCQSTDLIHWTDQYGGTVTFDALTSDDPSGIGTGVAILKQADGITPIIVDDKYWMIYFHGFSGGSMYMAWADVGDMLTWTTCYSGSPVLTPSGWEGSSLWTPSFVGVNDIYYIYYQGGSPYRIGFASAPATSGGNPVTPDNTPWTKSPNNPVITNTHGWDNGFCQDPVLRCFDGIYYIFYTGDPPWTNGFAYSDSPEGPWTQYGETGGGGANWTETGTPSVSNGIISFTSGQAIHSTILFTPGNAVGFRANFGPSGGGYRWGGFISGTGSSGGNDRAVIENYPVNIDLYLQTYPSSNLLTGLDNQFHVYEVLWELGRADAIVEHGLASTFSTTNVPSISLPLSFHNYTEPSPFDLDWVFIRNYSNPEPSSNVGLEQTFYTEPPVVNSPVIYCQGEIAVPLTATGTNLLWYTTPTGGTGSPVAPTPSTAIQGATSYYVSQTLNGYESERAQIDVIVNETPEAPIADVIQPTCTAPGGTITVTSPLTGLSFSIDGIDYSNTTGIFTEVNPGSYNLTAKNNYDCISPEIPIVINAFPGSPIAPTAMVTQPTCTVATGTITITAPSGPGMTYSKDGIDYTNTTGIFTEVEPGIYILTAKDISGCISLGTSVTVDPAPETPQAPTADVTQPTCNVPTGTITVTSSITGLFFSIDGVDYTNTTGVFTDVYPGTYDLTAKNSSGCISLATIIIVNDAPSSITGTIAAIDDSICRGEPFQLQLTEATGQPPFTLIVNGREYSGVIIESSFTTIPTADETIWDPTATPAILDNGLSTPYELGVKFKATANGYIKGIRFYKGLGNTGIHVGRLWTSDGILLGAATFMDETPTGWQQVLFITPVAITADTTYVASYSDPAGHFSLTMPYFNDTLVTSANELLQTLPSPTGSPANGVYNTTVGAFPDTTYEQSPNYWVDVVFAYSVDSAMVTSNLTSISDNGGCTTTGNPLSSAVVNILNPNAPIVNSPVFYYQGDVAVPLTAIGINLLWYTTPSGGIGSPDAPIPSTAIPGTTTYYVTQTIDGCESPRALIEVMVTGESGWFNENWQYRRPITISNPAGIPLTDYQVMISLDNSFDFTKANPDGSDIRVSDVDGTTLISFWIEHWNVTIQEALIWIKIPLISTNGSTIFLYYGNTSAFSASNGSTTFNLFDDDWDLPIVTLNPIQVSSQSWWESEVSYPIVFEDNSFPSRDRFHMQYDGHFVIGHAKGYATSPDLINWTAWDNGLPGSARINPTMGVGYTGGVEFAWGDLFKVGSIYHMYPSQGPGVTVHCQSNDLVHWTDQYGGTVAFDALTSDDPSGIGTGVALLKEADGITPIIVDDKYWMIYFHGFSGGPVYMAWADTNDLLSWTTSYGGSPVLTPSGWEGSRLWTPSFTYVNDIYYIYYQGGSPYQIGFASAPASSGGTPLRPDNTTWTKSPDNPVITNTHGWDNGFCQDPTLRCFDGIYYIFYTGDPPWTNGFAYSDNPEGPWTQYGASPGGDTNWTIGGNPSVSNGIISFDNPGSYIQSPETFSEGCALGYRANYKGGTTAYKWAGFINGYIEPFTYIGVASTVGTDLILTNYTTGPREWTSLGPISDSFHVYELTWSSGETKAYIDHSLAAIGALTNYVPTGPLPVSVRNHSDSMYGLDMDWIYLRKYIDPEPVSTIGDEEIIKFLDIKVILEGPFEGSNMNTLLNDLTILPLIQPYNTTPWNYPGIEAVTEIPNPDVVDWILVELRDATDATTAIPTTQIDRQAALLLRDGSITRMDGESSLYFSKSINQQLFVIIWHRNHLGILSADALIPNPERYYVYDFTTAISQAFGDGQKDLGSSIFGMIAGDANSDGNIDEFDVSQVWSILTGFAGYNIGDLDLNGQVNNQDKNDMWYENIGEESQIPE